MVRLLPRQESPEGSSGSRGCQGITPDPRRWRGRSARLPCRITPWACLFTAVRIQFRRGHVVAQRVSSSRNCPSEERGLAEFRRTARRCIRAGWKHPTSAASFAVVAEASAPLRTPEASSKVSVAGRGSQPAGHGACRLFRLPCLNIARAHEFTESICFLARRLRTVRQLTLCLRIDPRLQR